MDRFAEFMKRARAYYESLPAGRRTTLVASLALSLAATAALWGYAAYDPMVVLFSHPLDSRTTAGVIDYLEQQEIEHRIESGSERIYVPRSLRDRVAVNLKGSSIVGSASGMDLLDNAPIGSTQFMEHRRWTMALQREIEAQINAFEQVLASKVLLSVPEQSLFVEDKVDPSASVHLELQTGMVLSIDEGSRIAALVAAAVPRLNPDRVEILDSELRVIHAMRDSESEYGLSGDLAELRRQYDRYYTSKVERILERIVGPGKVVAQVHVDLDHKQTTIHRRELDSEGAVVISQRSRETESSGASAGGVPGVTANLPELEAANEGTGRSSSEADEVANIDVPDTQTHIAALPGGILSMTASVVVDGSWAAPEAAEGAEAGEKSELVYVARTEAELAGYTRLVASSLGIEVESVTIVNEPFAKIELTPETETGSGATLKENWSLYAPWTAVLLAMLLTFGFVIRPLMKQLAAPLADASEDEALLAEAAEAAAAALEEPEKPKTPEEALAAWLQQVAAGERYVTRDEVNQLVSADVVHSVVALKSWIGRETS